MKRRTNKTFLLTSLTQHLRSDNKTFVETGRHLLMLFGLSTCLMFALANELLQIEINNNNVNILLVCFAKKFSFAMENILF